MKKQLLFKSFLLLLSFLSFQNSVNACSCSFTDPIFCNNANDQHFIVQAVVNKDPEYQMEVTILENMHGLVPQDTILVTGQDGLNCGAYLMNFEIQDTLILALSYYSNGLEGVWYLDGCGRHYLHYSNGIISGGVTNSQPSQTIQEFRDGLLTCFDVSSAVEDLDDDSNLKLFPNPAGEQFRITTEQNLISGFDIFDTNGKQVTSKKLDQSVASLEVDSENLEKGIYFIRVRTDNGVLTRRFLRR